MTIIQWTFFFPQHQEDPNSYSVFLNVCKSLLTLKDNQDPLTKVPNYNGRFTDINGVGTRYQLKRRLVIFRMELHVTFLEYLNQ